MPDNDNKIEYNDNLPYSDENVGDIDDFENDLGDVPELSDEQKEQFKNRYGKDSFLKRIKNWFRKTWNGKNSFGQYLGFGLNVGELFLPKAVSRIRDIIQNKTQPKKDSNMNWLINRLQERSTWRGIITALTGLGVLTLGEEMRTTVITAGVAIFALVEVLMKDKDSPDAKK